LAPALLAALRHAGEEAALIGKVVEGPPALQLCAQPVAG